MTWILSVQLTNHDSNVIVTQILQNSCQTTVSGLDQRAQGHLIYITALN